jgi:hypothetical protein
MPEPVISGGWGCLGRVDSVPGVSIAFSTWWIDVNAVSLDQAKCAIGRRVAHLGSLCRRRAARCLGEMSVKECAGLFFRVLGRRLIVFEPGAAVADTGGH